MTADERDETTARGEPDEHAARLLGLVNLLADLALQTLRQGEVEAARGLVDSIESLKVKTRGNLDAAEDQLFESVLFQLRLAVVKGPPPAQAGDEEADDPPADDSPKGGGED